MDRVLFWTRKKRKTFILDLGNWGLSSTVCLHLSLKPTRLIVLKKDVSYGALIVSHFQKVVEHPDRSAAARNEISAMKKIINSTDIQT